MAIVEMSKTKVQLAELLEGGVPLIAVSFGDTLSDASIADAEADGLDVAELRIDQYSALDAEHVLRQVARFASLPTIATIRTRAEGGDWSGSEPDRLALFNAVLPHVDGIDIELSSSEILPPLVAQARDQGKVVVVSNHNFDHTPSLPELEDMAHEAKRLGADYVKLSAMARTIADVDTLATVTIQNAALGLIVIGMGTYGPLSRVFFPALGSRMTYAHHGGQRPVPGQLSYGDTFDMLRKFYPEFNQRKIDSMQIFEDV